jgi:hypothetical protein
MSGWIIRYKLAVAAWLSCLSIFAAPNQPIQPRVTLEVSQGLCPNGAFVPYRAEDGAPADLHIWGDYCPADQKQPPLPPLARTSIFPAPRYLRIYLCTYAQSQNLALERMSDGAKYLISPYDATLDRWRPYDFELPEDWVGKPVRLDRAAGTWGAFSEPVEGGKPVAGDALMIFYMTAMHFALIMVCAMALAAVAVLRGVRDTVHAGLIVLIGAALPGYLMFWLVFFSPRLGRYLAYAIPFVAGLALILCRRRLDINGLRVMKSLVAPVLLVGAVALLVLSTGYLNGGRRSPLALAAMRFSHPLPSDNELPFRLATGVKASPNRYPRIGYRAIVHRSKPASRWRTSPFFTLGGSVCPCAEPMDLRALATARRPPPQCSGGSAGAGNLPLFWLCFPEQLFCLAQADCGGLHTGFFGSPRRGRAKTEIAASIIHRGGMSASFQSAFSRRRHIRGYTNSGSVFLFELALAF